MNLFYKAVAVIVIVALLGFITGVLDKRAAARMAYEKTFGWLKGLR